jgi:hypothetical protein
MRGRENGGALTNVQLSLMGIIIMNLSCMMNTSLYDENFYNK